MRKAARTQKTAPFKTCPSASSSAVAACHRFGKTKKPAEKHLAPSLHPFANLGDSWRQSGVLIRIIALDSVVGLSCWKFASRLDIEMQSRAVLHQILQIDRS